MTYKVQLVPRAQCELDEVLQFLGERSLQGARAWLERWDQAQLDLGTRPLVFGFAPEASDWNLEIRQILFKTRRGRMYRAIFVVEGENVYVLNLRGPGQDFVAPDELGAIIR